MIGLVLQWTGAIFVALGFLIPRRARGIRRRCRYIGPTVYATISHECWPGQHRELVIGLIVAALGGAMFFGGRMLARRSGLD